MRYRDSALTALIVTLCFVGCDSMADKKLDDAAIGTISGTMWHDGLQREYVLYVPQSYDHRRAWPLVLNFHGYGSSAHEQMKYGDFRSLADQEEFIVLHPAGSVQEGRRVWDIGGGAKGGIVDDVGFTDELIKKVASEYSIDSARIYAAGMSNGGSMSFLLACKLGDKVAAIASVAGDYDQRDGRRL